MCFPVRAARDLPLSLMAKDVRIADSLARSVGRGAPLTRRTGQLWSTAEAKLRPGADHTEIYRYLASLRSLRSLRKRR